MHEWHTNQSKNPLKLIDEFMGFEFNTDYGERGEVTKVRLTNKIFSKEEEAITFVTNSSYGGETAYLAAYTEKKLTKGFQNTLANFAEKYKEYLDFNKGLTIAYGRKASKVTCPNCGSSISLKYGGRFRSCPVCRSKDIISDSNWKTLETKRRIVEKAAENLSKEAEKNDVTFVCGIEWHC